MRFLALFLLVVAYKFLTNLMHYFRIKKLQTYFSEFLEHKCDNMNLYRQEVLSLFEKAHVKDKKIPVSEHIGNRQIVSGNVSTFSMFPSTRVAFSVTTLNMFEEAEGVFRNMYLLQPFFSDDPCNVLRYRTVTLRYRHRSSLLQIYSRSRSVPSRLPSAFWLRCCNRFRQCACSLLFRTAPCSSTSALAYSSRNLFF